MESKEIINMATYILDKKETIRSAGKVFQIPKSTLHYYLTKRLKNIDQNLYNKLHCYLQNNFKEKHIRGGMATKLKYLNYHKK
ncbi:MAG: sporulation transcriptional regulator SpoIIID [Christensenellales bacterium]